jgi:hypothetical protein
MSNDHETNMTTFKVFVAWVGLIFGGLTLSNVALTLTIIFTLLQIYKLARDLWWPRKDKQ